MAPVKKKTEHSSILVERELLKKYIAPLLISPSFYTSYNEDAALVEFPVNRQIVVTSDVIIEGIHFLSSDPPETVAKKAIRVNLSDLAAMGARPIGYTLCLGMGTNFSEEWMEHFVQGLSEDNQGFNINLLGGDLSQSQGPTSIAITAFGDVGEHQALCRHKAQPGDRIYVSGTIGDAAIGLKLLQGERADLPSEQIFHFMDAYRLPQPRHDLAQALNEVAHAAIDISDGLLGDLQLLCAASQLHAYIRRDRIPLSKPVKSFLKNLTESKQEELYNLIMSGGDDYELLFTASPGETDHIEYLSRRYHIPLTCIGHLGSVPEQDRTTIHSQDHITLLDSKGQELSIYELGFQHKWSV